MKNEVLWKEALSVTQQAIQTSSIIPLDTKLEVINNDLFDSYELRHLLHKFPLTQNTFGPKKNPFIPWDKELSICNINDNHQLILNKYPVQLGHMLLITNSWMPQNTWLNICDFQALINVNKDTTGLWFYNSGPKAGASQPHRHFQLLPRASNERVCPRDHWFKSRLENQVIKKGSNSSFSGCYSISRINDELDDSSALKLYNKYLELSFILGLGDVNDVDKPLFPYNLLITSNWICIFKRSSESSHGFSINSLGFAGYILSTSISDVNWLKSNTLEKLLSEVIAK